MQLVLRYWTSKGKKSKSSTGNWFENYTHYANSGTSVHPSEDCYFVYIYTQPYVGILHFDHLIFNFIFSSKYTWPTDLLKCHVSLRLAVMWRFKWSHHHCVYPTSYIGKLVSQKKVSIYNSNESRKTAVLRYSCGIQCKIYSAWTPMNCVHCLDFAI